MGLFSSVGSLLTSLKQSKLAKKINPVDTSYADSVRSGGENPYIQSLYGQGRNLFQGRMAGADEAQQGIFTSGANAIANTENNATDASQALAIGAGVQGQTDSALTDLATKEAMDKQRRFGVFSNVSQLMAQEGDKVYQDKLRKYYDNLNYKRALQGAAQQNLQSGLGEMDDQVQLAAQLMSGGYIGGGSANGGRGQRGGQNQVRQPYYGYNPGTGGYYTD